MVSGGVTLEATKAQTQTQRRSPLDDSEIDKLVWDVKELHLGQLGWWGLLSFLL